MENLVPHVPRTVQAPDWQDNTEATSDRNADGLFRWFLNSTTMEVFWEDPTLKQIADGKSKNELMMSIDLSQSNKNVVC